MNLQYIEQLVYMRHTDLDRECPCHGELIELPDQRPTPQFQETRFCCTILLICSCAVSGKDSTYSDTCIVESSMAEEEVQST